MTRQGDADWGGILFRQTQADNRIRHAEIEYTHGVLAYGARVTIADSTLRHIGNSAFIQSNHIHDVSASCLHLNATSAIIERNRLHHCGDTGISISYPSSTTLVNNLVYASTDGIAIKDGATARIVNNTVADNQGDGIQLYEEHSGEGGGSAMVVNAILWGNETNLKVDALSTITVTYSDIYTYTATGTIVFPGGGNINADPLFRNPQNGNYRLLEDSACVDTGTATGAPDEDIQGIYRPHGDGHDLGAHEFFEYFSCYLPVTLRSH